MELIQRKTKSNFYVVRAQNGREKSVAEKILKQSEVGDLMGKVSRVIVPTEVSFYLKNGKKVKVEKVKFPGYIFVETNAVGELKYWLKGTNGAGGFLTNRAGDILPLTQSEVNRMIGEFEASKEVKEEDFISKFIPGEEVSILEGPFSTFNGKVESVKGDKVKVEVSVFGRVSLIELNIIQIDKKRD
jgi:transcriptional antiterminator NusG